MIVFAAAVFFLIATPGPAVLSLAGVAAAYGKRAATIFLLGLWLGNNLVALAVISGLAAAVLAHNAIRSVLFAASIAYLAYLAVKIAFAGSKIAFRHMASPPGIATGTVFQIINPKAYAVHTALFTGFPFWPDSLLFETGIKLAIMNAIWIPLHFLWMATGIMVRKLDLAPRVQFAVNIAMAVAMLAVVGLALFTMGG